MEWSMTHLPCNSIAEIGVADDGTQFKIIAVETVASRELALSSRELPRLLIGLLQASELLSATGRAPHMAFPVEQGSIALANQGMDDGGPIGPRLVFDVTVERNARLAFHMDRVAAAALFEALGRALHDANRNASHRGYFVGEMAVH
jgi:hypothetical protein